MSIFSKLWQGTIGALLNKMDTASQEKLLRQSFLKPIVRIWYRDSFRFYENGRWTTVAGELMTGSSGIDRIIYRYSSMKWNDTGVSLSEEERQRALQAVTASLDKRKVKWEFR